MLELAGRAAGSRGGAGSNFFEDELLFPKGSIRFDCALLMRGIEHEWHGKSDLCCPVADRAVA